jgi:hypothetical protein
MISAFDNALRRVYGTIPPEILEATFRPRDYQVSLDQRIKDVIVSARVLQDCNVNSGKIKRIPLTACTIETVLPDPGYMSVVNPSMGTLYRIPPSMREHRDIVGVIDISYPYDYTGYNSPQMGFGNGGNTVAGLAAAVLDSHTHRNACLTPTPTLLAGNMILINPATNFISDWVLVCRLGYDDEFTSLNRSSVIPLSDLILTATQAYIWVHLTIRIDQAMLSGGQELGQFKAIVDEYKQAVTDYNSMLLKFRGSTNFDPEVTRYLIRSML